MLCFVKGRYLIGLDMFILYLQNNHPTQMHTLALVKNIILDRIIDDAYTLKGIVVVMLDVN